MPVDSIPSREPELVTYAQNFSTLLTATPTAFGATAAQATSLASAVGAFVAAYNLAASPDTRTKPKVAAKNAAKDAMLANLRMISRVIQAYPSLTNAQRDQLGLTVRKQPAPRPVPTSSPTIQVVAVTGKTVRLRFADADVTNKRGKPKDCVGLTVFSAVAAQQPTDMSAFRFEGNTTLTTIEVGFPASVPAGATVWFTAFWRNARDESGPAAPPISTTLAGGMAQAA